MKEIWYRYDSYSADDREEVVIFCGEYEVDRHTQKGVWLTCHKFVLNEARKRFAYPTKEEALDSFRIRKNWELRYLQSRTDHVKLCIEKLKKIKTPDDLEQLNHTAHVFT